MSGDTTTGDGAATGGGSAAGGGGGGACDVMVTTADTYLKVEAATPGQTVCIAPGTYHFRVTLTKPGTAAAPITIRALDPSSRPVFDYTGWDAYDDGQPPFRVATAWPETRGARRGRRQRWGTEGA